MFVREEGDGTRIWTVVLSLGRRVTVSISTLDNTDDSNVATFALAMFIKAFEAELSGELVANSQADELSIQIARLDQVPTDLREYANKTMGMDTIVEKQTCAATRAVSYESALPIYVFLSASFLDAFEFGEGRGGSLQALFGFTLIELTHQLLLGHIDDEEIRPKVVSLVRETLS